MPSSPPRSVIGSNLKATTVPSAVANAATTKQPSSLPVSLMTRRISAFSSSKGTARGTNRLLIALYTGLSVGIRPTFTRLNVTSIVVNGALRAAPTLVFSAATPPAAALRLAAQVTHSEPAASTLLPGALCGHPGNKGLFKALFPKSRAFAGPKLSNRTANPTSDVLSAGILARNLA
eukprot:scaffold489_cov259-Pinguiococcus_pyrenoidosus.AAC.13